MSGSVLLSRVVMIVLALIVATISSVASAAQTGSIAMFEMRKENYYVDYNNGTGVWVEKDVLVRHDGFKLMRMGASREMQVEFRYTDGGLSFDFWAFRYDDHLNPTDTWDVLLGLALKYLPQRTGAPITIEEMHKIARNIDAALRAWPPRLRDKDTPIRRVRFDMRLWPAWNPSWGKYYEPTQPSE